MDLQIGDIVLADKPSSGSSGDRGHPALVIHVGESSGTVMVVSMTPDDASAVLPGNTLRVESADLADGNLEGPYRLRPDHIVTVTGNECSRAARMGKAKLDQVLREVAALMVRSHYHAVHEGGTFVPGKSRVPVAGRVYDDRELINLLNAGLDFWLTSGRYSESFEKAFTSFLGVEYCFLTNSGSSANLLAFMSLTSTRLGERRIRKGDEVVTVAAAFPTTVAPIIQYGAVPVFVDIRLPTYNIDCSRLEQALSDRTRAVMLAHTLGNPFDVDRILSFCRKHGLWLIEDCCDALGSAYTPSPPPTRQSCLVGTFGHLSTFSFYPAHHITMGEGGAVCTSDPDLKGIVQSLRDWGRDCWCPPGRDNTCGKRFSRQSGELPYGYDHKYVYSHLGYNLKITEMQAAVGCAQIEKLPGFIETRKRNWTLLKEGLADLAAFLLLPEPTAGTDPSWFGFPLTVREESPVRREALVARLESRGIQTRRLFSGNIIRHPCFDELRVAGEGYRIAGPLSETDRVMHDSFWVGVYPGLTPEGITYMVEEIHRCFSRTDLVP